MKKRIFLIFITLLISLIIIIFSGKRPSYVSLSPSVTSPKLPITQSTENTFSLSISFMKKKTYPGSLLTIEQTLPSTQTYQRYVTSYLSDGLKIYALMTIPIGKKPEHGWPVILFNHGYIPPSQYSTIESYAVMVDPLASHGYIVFKPDYRGNGNSQGIPTQVYVSSDYVTDSLNALASIRQYKDADSQNIGVIGHSMGGNITLHELVISNDFKAAELLSGVVGSYSAILDWWDYRISAGILSGNDAQTAQLVTAFVRNHGTPQTNPTFWNTIDPTAFVRNISTPVQIQVGTGDTDVPPKFSESLEMLLENNHKTTSFYSYPGADHNLSQVSGTVFQRTLSYFDSYIK